MLKHTEICVTCSAPLINWSIQCSNISTRSSASIALERCASRITDCIAPARIKNDSRRASVRRNGETKTLVHPATELAGLPLCHRQSVMWCRGQAKPRLGIQEPKGDVRPSTRTWIPHFYVAPDVQEETIPLAGCKAILGRNEAQTHNILSLREAIS